MTDVESVFSDESVSVSGISVFDKKHRLILDGLAAVERRLRAIPEADDGSAHAPPETDRDALLQQTDRYTLLMNRLSSGLDHGQEDDGRSKHRVSHQQSLNVEPPSASRFSVNSKRRSKTGKQQPHLGDTIVKQVWRPDDHNVASDESSIERMRGSLVRSAFEFPDESMQPVAFDVEAEKRTQRVRSKNLNESVRSRLTTEQQENLDRLEKSILSSPTKSMYSTRSGIGPLATSTVKDAHSPIKRLRKHRSQRESPSKNISTQCPSTQNAAIDRGVQCQRPHKQKEHAIDELAQQYQANKQRRYQESLESKSQATRVNFEDMQNRMQRLKEMAASSAFSRSSPTAFRNIQQQVFNEHNRPVSSSVARSQSVSMPPKSASVRSAPSSPKHVRPRLSSAPPRTKVKLPFVAATSSRRSYSLRANLQQTLAALKHQDVRLMETFLHSTKRLGRANPMMVDILSLSQKIDSQLVDLISEAKTELELLLRMYDDVEVQLKSTTDASEINVLEAKRDSYAKQIAKRDSELRRLRSQSDKLQLLLEESEDCCADLYDKDESVSPVVSPKKMRKARKTLGDGGVTQPTLSSLQKQRSPSKDSAGKNRFVLTDGQRILQELRFLNSALC